VNPVAPHGFQGVRQRSRQVADADPVAHRGQRSGGEVRGWHVAASDRLRQGTDQGGDELLAQPGDLPAERGRVEVAEDVERYMDRDSIGLRTWVELVAQRQRDAADLPGRREGVLVHGSGLGAQQDGVVIGEQVGLVTPGLLPPTVEMAL
jgi:hypothetical protein